MHMHETPNLENSSAQTQAWTIKNILPLSDKNPTWKCLKSNKTSKKTKSQNININIKVLVAGSSLLSGFSIGADSMQFPGCIPGNWKQETKHMMPLHVGYSWHCVVFCMRGRHMAWLLMPLFLTCFLCCWANLNNNTGCLTVAIRIIYSKTSYFGVF